MPQLIEQPCVITAVGTKPKRIEEYAGRVATKNEAVSVARMVSPQGTSVVIKGILRVEHENGVLEVRAGQAVICQPREWVRYSTPEGDGAEYVAICIPAFSPEIVHRDPE